MSDIPTVPSKRELEVAAIMENEARLATQVKALRRERDEIEGNARDVIAALVELAGGEVRIPRRLILDPPNLLMVDDPTGDDWRVYRTRR